MVVFVVEHVHEFEDREEEVKMLGVYSAQAKAEQAVERFRLLPGFREVPDGFHINSHTLDADSQGWTEGYFTYHGEQGEEPA